MCRVCSLALFSALVVLSAGSFGQDKKDKADPKDPATKVKGVLPPNWKKIGLTDVQVQDIYKIQAKYRDEISKLKAKISELESAQHKEEKAILTPEQKKRLEEILVGKDKEK
jgi:hypothetical protein